MDQLRTPKRMMVELIPFAPGDRSKDRPAGPSRPPFADPRRRVRQALRLGDRTSLLGVGDAWAQLALKPVELSLDVAAPCGQRLQLEAYRLPQRRGVAGDLLGGR